MADWLKEASRNSSELADKFGTALVRGFHLLALFAIGATIVWAAIAEFFKMVAQGHATVEDILLLFIFLELGAMVGIYFTTNHMPVRFLIYIALTSVVAEIVERFCFSLYPTLTQPLQRLVWPGSSFG